MRIEPAAGCMSRSGMQTWSHATPVPRNADPGLHAPAWWRRVGRYAGAQCPQAVAAHLAALALLSLTACTIQAAERQLRPSFTLIALPDTQNYSKSHPEIFTAQTQWIVNQKTTRNIVFVTHLGDIVQDGDELPQWINANVSMSILDGPAGVPYGLCIGNHDQEPREDPDGTTNFNHTFPYARYSHLPWYGGHYGDDNDNSFQLFSASGLDFVIVHLEFNPHPDPDVLAWADNVLKTHASRRAIVSSHALMSKTEPDTLSDQGLVIYDALKDDPNLFLMLCGHCSGLKEGRRTDTWNGHTVHTLLSDYQKRSNGGDGWLRIMKFDPDYNRIQVHTYSPTLDQYERDDSSEFVLPYGMGGPQTVAADFNRDTDVDMADFSLFQACYSEPYIPLDEDCIVADLDANGHVDRYDLTVFLRCLGGKNVPVDLTCDQPL